MREGDVESNSKSKPARPGHGRVPAGRSTSRGGRIGFRIKPETKSLLLRAAALSGSSLTTFLLESAQDRAVKLIERFERLRFSNLDRDRLLAALDAPPAPSAALRRAARKYSAR